MKKRVVSLLLALLLVLGLVPGALALDEDSTLYISYRWARSGWHGRWSSRPAPGPRWRGWRRAFRIHR